MKYPERLFGETELAVLFDYGLRCRAYNALCRCGFDYVETLISLRTNMGDKKFRKMLISLPTIGVGTAASIEEAITKFSNETGRIER